MPPATVPSQSDLNVVVPTIGRATLRDCLMSLAAGASHPGKVIVVDQADHEQVRGWVAEAGETGLAIERVRAPRRGPGPARNVGVSRATSRLVAAVDDDCRVASDWVDQMVSTLERYPAMVVTGRVEGEGGLALPSTITDLEPHIYRDPPADRDPLFTNNIGATAEVWQRVGLFDEHPALGPAAEDNEWAYRALRLGVPIRYSPEVVIQHLDWRSDEELVATARRYARGQGGFYGLYLRRRDWFIARRAARDLARGPWWLLRGKLTGNQQLVAQGRIQTRDLPAGILAGLGRRRAGSTDRW